MSRETQIRPDQTTLEDMMEELAAGLRDVIHEASNDYIKEDPENAFIDLACTLVLRLQGKLAVVPFLNSVESTQSRAASRIFDIFTRWMQALPGRSYSIRINPSGKFQVAVKTPSGAQVFFGNSIQDACAQAAQTICFDEEGSW